MSPIGALLTAVFSLVILSGTRRSAVLGLIAGVCYLTQGQAIQIAGFTLTAIRILLLVGVLRVIQRGEFSAWRANTIDKTFIAYVFTIATVGILREGSTVIAFQLGFLYNALLSYGVLRSLIRSLDDLQNILRTLAVMIVPLAALMTIEGLIERNVFSAFGGVSSGVWTRGGDVRSMGAFRNPITAGSFGATLAPLFVGLIFSRIDVRRGQLGLFVSTVIVVAAHSSGPLMAYVLGAVALCCWPWRQRMTILRRGLAFGVLALHLVMKAPVWMLIGRVSGLVGGGGYHRAYIIDRFIERSGTWWFLGTSDTSDWMATRLSTGLADITNQFVLDGINGGIWGFILGILVMVRCFQGLGRALGDCRGRLESREKMLWCVGCAFFAHIANEFAVTYFDQMHVMWYLILASVASVSEETLPVNDEITDCEDPSARLVLPSL